MTNFALISAVIKESARIVNYLPDYYIPLLDQCECQPNFIDVDCS